MKPIYYIAILCCSLLMAGCGSDDPVSDPGTDPNPSPSKPTEKAYYVSPTGSDSNNGTAAVFPFKSFDKVLSVIKPGDVVNLMNGTYQTAGGPVIALKRKHSGEDGKYITFKAMEGHKPKIVGGGENVWNAVEIDASYIIFDGIELEGYSQQLNYNDAYNMYQSWVDGTIKYDKAALYNTNAIAIGNREGLCHHVIIRNCIIHDFPGAGLGASQSDYITFENNVVYNNAWYTMYACSGISVIVPYNSDDKTGYKIKIIGNYCHSNKTLIPWNNIKKLSDGNGIIIDINNRAGDIIANTDPRPYMGRTLVQNNISVNNGGSGIHSFKANHVDIINNTAYHNGTVVGYADIHSNTCQDVNIKNNIMYARADNKCNEKPGNATEVYDYNIYFGGIVAHKGANDIVADPMFVNLSLDRETADFHLKPGSPALGSAPEGKNRGAYE